MTDVQQESPVSAALKAWKADTERIDAEYEASAARHRAGLQAARECRDESIAAATAKYQEQIDAGTADGVKISIGMNADRFDDTEGER
jgi:hypothetical protein